jgi:hypothetical protein
MPHRKTLTMWQVGATGAYASPVILSCTIRIASDWSALPK